MQNELDDQAVLKRIERLVAEEQQLETSAKQTASHPQRLKAIGVALDRCWDLLRQRRALREFGRDPDKAQARSADTVERYKP